MEFGPILKTLIRNKTRSALIGLEVALTLAIVVNCINMMQDMKSQIERPTGLDELNIIAVRSQPFAPEFREEGYLDNSRNEDLRTLRALPGVRAADYISQIPLSGSGSSSGYKPLGSDMNTLPANIFTTGAQGIESLGVRLIAGRNFTMDDILSESDSKNVIITKAYADRLFPNGDSLGRRLQGREPENPDTIVGIVEQMHGSWPTWTYVANVMLRPGRPGNFNWGVRYLVRAEQGQIGNLLPLIEKNLLEANQGRNVEVRTLEEVKAETFEAQIALIKMLTAVIFLLVFVTSLGIVGITSFSVTERTHHIGTRRALGARKLDILRYFLTENWIVTTSGLILGVMMAYGLNFALVSLLNGAKLEGTLVAYSIVGMWLIGQVAAFFPAWRGARVSPALATRTV